MSEKNLSGVIYDTEFFQMDDLLMIFGFVEKDNLGRWKKGDFMRSSPIWKTDKEKLLVYTLNSIYKVDRIIPSIPINLEQLSLIEQGMKPSEIALLAASKSTKH